MTVKGWDIVSAWIVATVNNDRGADVWRERVAWYFGIFEYAPEVELRDEPPYDTLDAMGWGARSDR